MLKDTCGEMPCNNLTNTQIEEFARHNDEGFTTTLHFKSGTQVHVMKHLPPQGLYHDNDCFYGSYYWTKVLLNNENQTTSTQEF